MIVILDFGSQTTHLIGRRLRELGATVTIITPEEYSLLDKKDVKGYVLSGGPASVYEKDSPTVDTKLFEEGVPILGICYGQQLITYLLKGRVKKGTTHEYGPANITVLKSSKLLKDTADVFRVWMSHGDQVTASPPRI